MLDTYFRSKRMAESTGAGLYGTNLSRWPARTVDAFDCIEVEAIRHDQARDAKRDS